MQDPEGFRPNWQLFFFHGLFLSDLVLVMRETFRV